MKLSKGKAAVVSILAAVGLFLVVGCGHRDGEGRPDTIRIAFSSDPHTLNPLFLSDLNSYTVSEWIFNGLTKLNEHMNIVGDLAESWEMSKDGLELKFHLKKGVLWHDGKEFTSRDVVFTYNAVTSPDVATPHSAQFGPVKSISAPDPYTVRIIYYKPYGSALMSWTMGIIPEHVLHNRDLNDGTFGRQPVGTGPYRLKEWAPGEKLVLESFARGCAGSPKIRALVVRIIPDPATRLLETRTGKIDMTEIAPIQFAKQTGAEYFVRNFNKYRSPNFRYGFLGFNLEDPRFHDKRVRQAISHAIDKEAIIEAVLFGCGRRSTGPYSPGSPYESDGGPRFDYDPARAAALLAEAGWHKAGNGFLMKDGKIFSFTLTTNYESEENIKTAEIIQNSLKTIGMEVKIVRLEWQTFRHTVIKEHAFEAIILSRAYIWDPDLYDLWHSSKTKAGDWNFLSFRNIRTDRLLETGRTATDDRRRKEIYRQVHATIAGEQPCIFLYDSEGLFLANKRVKGIRPAPIGIYYNIADWSVSD